MNEIILKIHDNQAMLREVPVVAENGQPVIIQAKNGVNYEFYDKWLDSPPHHLINKRVDSDLHISFEREGGEVDVIIQGFFNNENQSLIGAISDDVYYNYIPDTGEIEDYVTLLNNGDVEGYALGGEVIQSALWSDGVVDTSTLTAFSTTSVLTFLPWLGLGVVPFIFKSKGKRAEPEPESKASVTTDDDKEISSEEKDATTAVSSQLVFNVISDTDKNMITLIDNKDAVEELTVDGEGVWTVDNTSGTVIFTADEQFTGEPSPVSYQFTDNVGEVVEGLLLATDIDSEVAVAASEGRDILLLATQNEMSTIDFSNISNITDIEKIDISNDTAEKFTISASDVLAVTDTDNILFVDGDTSDNLNVSNLTKADSSEEVGYDKYFATTSDQDVTLYIHQDIII